MKMDKGQSIHLSTLRKRAEELLNKKTEAFQSMPLEDIQRLIHELNVHQIELEMQNEELRQAQLEIEESHRRYFYLYDFAPVGYFTLNEKGLIVEVNLTGADMLGVERRFLIKRRFSGFINRDFQNVFSQHRNQVFKSGDKQSCQLKLIKKDGTEFYAQMESVVIKDNRGDIKQSRTTIIDITENVNREEKLQASKESLARAQEVAHLGNWEWDIETDKVTWSDELYRLYGIDPKTELKSYKVIESIHPYDRDYSNKTIARWMEDRKGGQFEYRIMRPDGSVRFVSGIGDVICDEDGKPVRMLGVVQDVTERKQVEEELRKYRQHLEELVEERTDELKKTNEILRNEVTERKRAEEKLSRKHQVQVALKDILSISTKPCDLEEMLDRILGRIVSIDWLTLESKSCIFLSDGNSNELVLKSYRDFSDILINSCTRIPLNKCVCGKAAATKKIQFIASDNSDHEIQPEDISPHSHYCVPILSSNKVLGVLNLYVEKDHRRNQEEEDFLRSVADVLAGIIERKQAEENLRDRQQEIEEINATLENRVQEELEKSRQKDYIIIKQSRMAAMGEMIRFITHQWGQPLWALQLLFHNIEDSIESSGINSENTDEFIANGFALVKRMFTTMNDFKSFFQEDKKKVTFSINKNVKDTLSLIGASFKYGNIPIRLNEKEELMVLGFPNEFSQVILNILKNANDAIVEKGIDGEIKIDFLCEGDSAIIRVKDNGGGIPEKILNKIFDSYFTTKKEDKGTGIGLYLSKIIIEERMKGCIKAKNTKEGVEFEINLPMIQS